MLYTPRRPAQNEELTLRGLKFHVYRWSGTNPQPTLLLHGWGDTGATWQFVADHLSAQRTWLAPDLRGFGRTQRPQDGYFFPDYLADLDALIDQISPRAPVDLIGHSMGGNIALLYAGVRPQRVRKLVSLEGFGMDRTTPDQAPARYLRWLNEVKDGTEFFTYDDYAEFIKVLALRHPRIGPARLEYIAHSWARKREDGRVELWADPKHLRVNPVLYQRDQAEACWKSIVAPVLFVIGERSDYAKRMAHEIAPQRLQELIRNVTSTTVHDASHMLQHERPEELAEIIEAFLSRP